jgi:2-methylisocitrate lyase-like PEP mutase family enzyme
MTAAEEFRALHRPGEPLLMANAWDAGSAVLLASLGFKALATTSSGFAATLGRVDGSVSREEALVHGATLAEAVDVPVSADLENGFADDPDGVAETVRGALAAGLAGCSIEDHTGRDDAPIYPFEAAVERVAAAVQAADRRIVVTARCEHLLHGLDDLGDVVRRLQAYQDAGADVLFAPGLARLEDIRTVVREVDRPVNVLTFGGGPTMAELAGAGVARVSVGGAFAFAGLAAVVDAAEELLGPGTTGFLAAARRGSAAARKAFQKA